MSCKGRKSPQEIQHTVHTTQRLGGLGKVPESAKYARESRLQLLGRRVYTPVIEPFEYVPEGKHEQRVRALHL